MLYLSLGTNLGNREANIERAIQLIGQHIGHVTRCATPIETAPVGFESAHAFLNSAIEVDTTRPIEEILHDTQRIELEMGRINKSKNGIYHDRIIDIDLLFYDERVIATENLRLPHPHLTQRLFVLEPLAEIAPDLVHPFYGKTIAQLLTERRRCSIEPLQQSMITPQLLQSINALLAQLSAHAHSLTLNQLEALTAEHNPHTEVYLLFDNQKRLIGTATLSYCRLLTGLKAWIEDVVVDESARGNGYARILLTHLLAQARQRGADSVNLTSRPTRQAANRLYQRMGFERRETNVYKYALAPRDK